MYEFSTYYKNIFLRDDFNADFNLNDFRPDELQDFIVSSDLECSVFALLSLIVTIMHLLILTYRDALFGSVKVTPDVPKSEDSLKIGTVPVQEEEVLLGLKLLPLGGAQNGPKQGKLDVSKTIGAGLTGVEIPLTHRLFVSLTLI
uniref:Uncharacterized protein n=1 Tax=Glossina pallidipes TaxID=7398 RepID=A0A1A9ZZC3_GLOPL